MSGRDPWPEPATWHFGEYPEDGEAWLAHPEHVHAYVDFRLRGADAGGWRRVWVVTHAWMRRQLSESTGGAGSWPSLLVIPDGTPEQKRAWITDMIALGGPVLEANSEPLPADWRPASGPRPDDEW